MSIAAPSGPAADWDLVPMGRTGWRICDPSRAHADPARVVGYAQKCETGAIEVLWLRSPCPHRSRYRDLDDLLDDLDEAVAAAAASTTARAAEPLRIPHFPPAS